MTPVPSATSAHERPAFFPMGAESLFGVLTSPPGEHNGVAAIVLSGGGATAPATNRNRLSVHMCRQLAALGYHAARFDYHGIGESTGVLAGAPKVYEPYLHDIEAAVGWVRSSGLDRFILIGSCFGARTALSYAPQLDGLEGLILVSPPLRDIQLEEGAGTRLAHNLSLRQAVARAARLQTIRGLAHPTRRRAYGHFVKAKTRQALGANGHATDGVDHWVSAMFLEPLRRLAAGDIPVRFVYGTKDWHYDDFERGRSGRLGNVLDASPLTDVTLIEGEVHGLTNVRVQEEVAEVVMRTVTDWSDSRARAVMS